MLRSRPRTSAGGGKRFQHRQWIERHVQEYLETSPCARLDISRRQELKAILRGSRKRRHAVTVPNYHPSVDDHPQPHQPTAPHPSRVGFGLSEEEALQILDTMPTEPVELHLLVSELHARMPERQQEALLELVAAYTAPTPRRVPHSADGGTVRVEPVVKLEADEEIL